MANYREILRLASLKHSQREIAASLKCSRNTIGEVLNAAKEMSITWPLDNDVTNAELEALLFPDKRKAESIYAEPDYTYIHRELAKTGVTLTLLWEEYCRTCHESGRTPYMSTQFGDKYRKLDKGILAKSAIKIKQNITRGKEVNKSLADNGWVVLTLLCSIGNLLLLLKKEGFLSDNSDKNPSFTAINVSFLIALLIQAQ